MRLIPTRLWGLAVVSSVLQVLPFPIAGPVPVWRTAFCWVALLPLLYALLAEARTGEPLTVRQGSALAYLNGVLWYLGNCYWIFPTMHIYGGLSQPVAVGILVLFCLYLGLYHALFGALLVRMRRSPRLGRQGALLLAPFLWVAVELARARVTGLPWDLLGIAQVDNRVLTRLAPWTGAYGISFVIAAVNALWLVRMQLRDRRYTRPLLTLAGLLLVVMYVLLERRFAAPREERATARATLVQENLEVGAAADGTKQPSAGELLAEFARMSLQPSRGLLLGIPELGGTRAVVVGGRPEVRTDLIVWPESPAPFEEQDPQFRLVMAALARAADAPVIVGNIALERTGGPGQQARI